MQGSALLRFFSAEGCTTSDMEEIASYLLSPGSVASLALLGEELPDSHAFALAVFILRQDPKEGADCTAYFHQTSPRFVRNCGPVAAYRWVDHMQISAPDGHVESVRVSPYLFRVLCATEDLLNLQGRLVNRKDV